MQTVLWKVKNTSDASSILLSVDSRLIVLAQAESGTHPAMGTALLREFSYNPATQRILPSSLRVLGEAYRGGGFTTPPHEIQILTKVSRIPSSVENPSVII
jgi:hypothetical protein